MEGQSEGRGRWLGAAEEGQVNAHQNQQIEQASQLAQKVNGQQGQRQHQQGDEGNEQSWRSEAPLHPPFDRLRMPPQGGRPIAVAAHGISLTHDHHQGPVEGKGQGQGTGN